MGINSTELAKLAVYTKDELYSGSPAGSLKTILTHLSTLAVTNGNSSDIPVYVPNPSPTTNPDTVNLTDPFSPTQFGNDLLLWVDASDINQVIGTTSSVTGVRSKGVINTSLIASSDASIAYNSTEKAISLKTGSLVSNTSLTTDKPLIFILFKDAGTSPSAGFVSLGGYNDGGIFVSRQPYGNTSSQLQMGAYSTNSNIFVDFIGGDTNLISIFSDTGSMGIKVNGKVANTMSVGEKITTLPFYINASNANSGNSQLFYEIIIVPNYYPYLAELIEGYVAWKWNKVSLLSDGHTFKLRQPLVRDYFDLLSLPTSQPGYSYTFDS